jgi:hypothetical protein
MAGGASGGTGGVSTLDGGASCRVGRILERLGKNTVLVGAAMEDSVASSAPFDLRYLYLAGGVFDGSGPCTSCATNCTAKGTSCANSGPGCIWWGCWQWDQEPPGAYVRNFSSTAAGDGQIPMITYYELLQTAGTAEGAAEVAAANDAAIMGRYLADFQFVLEQIGDARAFVHIEPDFWGYAQHVSSDPHATPAAVASASAECAGFENTIAGLGACMIAMVRAHAPNALVGLHASGWGTLIDVLNNTNPSLDVAGEAAKLGAFLEECGATSGDFIVVDPSDRDAAWYEAQGQDRWWDPTNATLPNFTQAFSWATALSESLDLPILWWQVPVGNMSLENTTNRWQDNRLDYFFDHMDELTEAHGFAVAYGAGDGEQTHPSSDDGHLVSRVQAYSDAEGQVACP